MGFIFENGTVGNSAYLCIPYNSTNKTGAMMMINRMLALAVDNHLNEGIKYPNNGPMVTNIQYADDTLIFLDPSEEHVVNLKRILCCFQAYSGLKINFSKSSITGVGVSKE